MKNKEEFFVDNHEFNKMLGDLQLTLKSLNYTKKEINSLLPHIIQETKKIELTNKEEKKISFEYLLKVAMNHIDNDSSNIDG